MKTTTLRRTIVALALSLAFTAANATPEKDPNVPNSGNNNGPTTNTALSSAGAAAFAGSISASASDAKSQSSASNITQNNISPQVSSSSLTQNNIDPRQSQSVNVSPSQSSLTQNNVSPSQSSVQGDTVVSVSNSTTNVNNIPRQPVATALAPALTSGLDTCMGSSSVGAQGVGFGLSVGSTWIDENCKRLKNSRELRSMGYSEAALALLCQDPAVASAMKTAGTECKIPAVEVTRHVTSPFPSN